MVHGAERGPDERGKEEALLGSLVLLERTVRSHGTSHPLARQIAGRLAQSIHDAGVPLSLQFVGAAVFRDLSLVPISLQLYKQLVELSRSLRNLGVDELTFDAVPGVSDLVRLGDALTRGAAKASDALGSLAIGGMSWRAFEGARWGLDTEMVDPDIYTATQVALAVVDAEHLVAGRDKPWDWARGLAVVRRLDRAFRVSPPATERALEIFAEGWSVARRAVSAGHRALAVLDNLGATRVVRRAVTHGTLALAVQGLRPRGGEPIVPSAQTLLPRLVTPRGFTRTGVEPHRLRVAALVHRFHPEYAQLRKTPCILHLVLIAYELERRRCPKGTDFDLTSGDLLALAVQEAGVRYDPGFVHLVVETAGRIPVGAHVRLADGRAGIVLSTNPTAPRLPKVLVAAQVVTPTSPVSLISPFRRTGD
ncbi:MAG: hypothetical protein ABIK09_09690 [Pseudomonadota bacterium]